MIPKLKEESYANFGGINQKASRYTTGLNEALDIVNYDFSTLSALTKRPGSTQYIGATLSGTIRSLYEFNRLSGFSQIITSANTNAYAVVGNSFNSIRSNLLNDGIFNFVTFVDRLFASNGVDFFKYDGTNATNFSLPPGPTLTGVSISGSSVANGLSGVYTYYIGYLNDRGYLGPAINGFSVALTSVSAVTLQGLTTPSGYGITALPIYRTGPNLTTPQLITYAPVGATQFIDGNLSLGTVIANGNLWFTMAPQFIEIYNNQAFYGGFSAYPSTVYFSGLGEPEGIGATASFEVRTNDGDYVTAGKAYFSNLVIAKQRSVHALSGDNPNNFSLRQISDQFGCISKRAIATYDNTCFFLDEKGVCEFDGANIQIISTRMEPIFRSMNLPVARVTAQMLHVKPRNEIWTVIPINGASFNNTIVIFDYVANAWGHFDGLNAASVANLTGYLSTKTVGFGDFSGAINYLGASFFSDNGRAMTTLVKFPFKNGSENSTEHFWRRLWLDADVFGLTQSLNINLYANQSSLPAFSTTLVAGPFQNRIEFGVSSKDLSLEVIHASDSPLRLNGYTFAHRFQRDV